MKTPAPIAAIFAMDYAGGIGRNNTIPWKCPEDMKRFREKTAGKVCIMGRNTFESIVEMGIASGRVRDTTDSPLPGRACIVLTRSTAPSDVFSILERGCSLASSVGDALGQACKLIADGKVADTSEIMVIGGAKVYKAFMPYYSRMYGTVIREEFDCDAIMPALLGRFYQLKVEEVNEGFEFFTYELENGK